MIPQPLEKPTTAAPINAAMASTALSMRSIFPTVFFISVSFVSTLNYIDAGEREKDTTLEDDPSRPVERVFNGPQMDQWVWKKAAAQRKDCQERYPSDPRLRMSVNLSARGPSDPQLLEVISKIIVDARIDPADLIVEVTESVLLDDTELTADFLRGVKDLGVELALDDFGTAFSSLSYVRRFPFDNLKLDISFTSEVHHGTATRSRSGPWQVTFRHSVADFGASPPDVFTPLFIEVTAYSVRRGSSFGLIRSTRPEDSRSTGQRNAVG